MPSPRTYELSRPAPSRAVKPEFLVALINQDVRRSVLRQLAAKMNAVDIFEAVHNTSITSAQGAEILMLQREAEPWVVRFFRWLFE